MDFIVLFSHICSITMCILSPFESLQAHFCYGVGEEFNFILMYMDTKFTHLKGLFFFHWIVLVPLSKIKWHARGIVPGHAVLSHWVVCAIKATSIIMPFRLLGRFAVTLKLELRNPLIVWFFSRLFWIFRVLWDSVLNFKTSFSLLQKT